MKIDPSDPLYQYRDQYNKDFPPIQVSINNVGEDVVIDREFIKNFSYLGRGHCYEIAGSIKCRSLDIKVPIFFHGDIIVEDLLHIGDPITVTSRLSVKRHICSSVSIESPEYAELHVVGKVQAGSLWLTNYVSVETKKNER